MRNPAPNKRARLIQTAAKLTYRHGFRTTSLADIAQGARVPLGNVYYYFKTKDEIGEAVVQQRLTESRALRQECNRAGSPKERLQAYVEAILASRDEIVRGGCPTGTLCSELHKEGGPVAQKAIALLTEPLVWMEEQFKAGARPPLLVGSLFTSLLHCRAFRSSLTVPKIPA